MILPDDQLRAILEKSGAIPQEILTAIVKSTTAEHGSLSKQLVARHVLTEEQLGQIMADAMQIPFVTLSKLNILPTVFDIVPPRIRRKSKVVAYAKDDATLKIAMSDPRQKNVPEMLSKKTGLKVEVAYATDSDLGSMINLNKKALQVTVDDLLKKEIALATRTQTDSLPIVKIVDTLINTAYEDRTSDIHIEPQESESLVRFRIDGVLQDVLRLPKQIHDRMITRIKVLSNLRTDEHMSAQDGKMRMQIPEEQLDIRVSILPVTGGEKAVLRLLSSKSREYSLASLGISPGDLAKLERAYSQTYGMILSTGPTGSGKTTSIYAMLKILNIREKNITTIEDPVEYWISGANQVQVNVKTNLTFADGLRSILRQDPNIIFVGEIRDNETAGIAVNAALTGHLVLSTLHTNDAATAIPRLSDMGVEPFLVASTVRVIIAQRLLRKICDGCKTSVQFTKEELTKHFSLDTITKYFPDSTDITTYHGTGCKLCHNTGYKGRLGVFEVLEVSKEIRKLIAEKSDADLINQQALKEGMNSMLDDAMTKVQQGLTTIEEVIRVTKSEAL
ncbi:MAG: GspE/PulE family protein [bacterium]